MSLTVVLKAVDGLVLAADSRMTEGYTLDGPRTRDDSVKFIQLHADAGALTYGLSDIGHAGLSALKKALSHTTHQTTQQDGLTLLASKIFSETSKKWGADNPAVPRRNRDVGFIIAQHERRHGKAAVYNFQSPDFEPSKVQGGCLLAGQWHVARFITNNIYTSDMTIATLVGLAHCILALTMSVEKTVGGDILIATVTENSGFRWLSREDAAGAAENFVAFQNACRSAFQKIIVNLSAHSARIPGE